MRLSPLLNEEPAPEKLTQSADRRLAAISKLLLVRVEGSKKRPSSVRPRRVGTFLIGLAATAKPDLVLFASAPLAACCATRTPRAFGRCALGLALPALPAAFAPAHIYAHAPTPTLGLAVADGPFGRPGPGTHPRFGRRTLPGEFVAAAIPAPGRIAARGEREARQ